MMQTRSDRAKILIFTVGVPMVYLSYVPAFGWWKALLALGVLAIVGFLFMVAVGWIYAAPPAPPRAKPWRPSLRTKFNTKEHKNE